MAAPEGPDRAPLRPDAAPTGARSGKRRRRLPLVATLALALPWAACHGLEGDYSSPRLLTVTASPVPGTGATPVSPIACWGTLEIESQAGDRLSGRFTRGPCAGLPNPTPDLRGAVSGRVRPDGTAALMLSPAPLSTSEAVTTSGGCLDDPAAAGPYTGRMTGASLDVSARFRLYCAGLPAPAPPAFDVEYRLAARRRLPPTWLEELSRAWRRIPPRRRGP
jgi:hypothetical protein